MRLDKWLWQARFYRTRTLAAEMVSRGKVRINARIARKPAAPVGSGDILTLVQGGHVRVVRITDLPQRRGSAAEASTVFEDVNPD